MEMIIFAVRDNKQGFQGIALEPSEGVAVRNFGYATKHNETLKTYPEDFALYRLGKMNIETGEITPEDKTLVCEALSVVNAE